MKALFLSMALAAPFFLSGCVVSVGGDGDSHYSAEWEDREYNNRRHISELALDMTYESVLRKMGVADFSELYQKADGAYRVLYYRTQRTMGDGVTTKDECTPLVFRDSQLVGWGEAAFGLMGN